MNLMKFELKKMLTTRVMIISMVGVFLLNLYSVLLGEQYDPSVYCASAPALQTEISRLQEEMEYFAGEINAQWAEKYRGEANAIRNDPANFVSDEEKEHIRRDVYGNLTDEAFDEIGNFKYLRESVLHSREYQKYEDAEFSARFYELAERTGLTLAETYRYRFPGEKGDVLAAKAEKMYGYMANEYTAYYNYDWGWHKFRNLHLTYPFTIGLIILIALAPLFASEYSGKTDALLLSSKHGKKRLIHAKIGAGFLFAALSWAIVTLTNIVLVFSIYGTQGADAYWQDWMVNWSPFPWNQLQITLVTLATSFLGALLVAGFIMLLSAFSKSQFIALLTGIILLLLPIFSFAFSGSELFQRIYNFLPTRVLTAFVIWQDFSPVYLFGRAVHIQHIIIVFSFAIIMAGIFGCFYKFKNHQVEN